MSALSFIDKCSEHPVDMFKTLIGRLESKLIFMNLATVDREFCVLNRTMVYRGLIDDCVVFVTERNSQKYANLKEQPKVSLTMLFPAVPSSAKGGLGHSAEDDELWQVRLFDARAEELNEEQIGGLWAEESLFAKIRSHICECGKPVQHEELQQAHDQLIEDYKAGRNSLAQTKTYTAFKVSANRWDFYKTQENKIADRVQYSRLEDNKWEVKHVSA